MEEECKGRTIRDLNSQLPYKICLNQETGKRVMLF